MKAFIPLTRWAPLSLFGNSMLARLVLLTPAVALFVRLQQEYLEDTFGLTHAVWLYWSLIFISAGQILFAWRCPQLIKKYGRDDERFKVESLTVRTDVARKVLKRKMVRALFEEHGGPLRARSYEHYTQAETYLKEHYPQLPGPDKASAVMQFNHHYIPEDGSALDISIGATKQLMRDAPSALIVNYEEPRSKKAIRRFLEIMEAAARDQNNPSNKTEWEIMALDWEYERTNTSDPASRFLITLLYGVGSLYFIYSGVRGIVLMLGYTLGIDHQ